MKDVNVEVENGTVARPTLTEGEAALVVQVFTGLFRFGMGVHPNELEAAGAVLDVAANMCRKAAEIHRDLQVPWSSMCWAARLPAVMKQMKTSQDLLEQMLGILHIDLIRQERPVRGCAMPNFHPAEDGSRPVGDDLTVLG